MNKIEHIGVAVRSLSLSIPLFEKLLGTPCYKTESVLSEKVNTAFFKTGESKIELLESMEPDGLISNFVEKNGEGMHHIAFEVDDLQAEIERLKAEGFKFINEEPKRGADNKMVCFLHPKTTNGMLVEICQQVLPV
jgi:methylmalonyl-CoA/ethylmalonyl-CoA epimerase